MNVLNVKINFIIINVKKMLRSQRIFENCKVFDNEGKYCSECKEDYYLNLDDNLCYKIIL